MRRLGKQAPNRRVLEAAIVPDANDKCAGER